MSRMGVISDALNQVTMYETLGKSACVLRYVSNTLISIMRKLKDLGYIADFELINDRRGVVLKLNLKGRINQCREVRPNFYVKVKDIQKFEKRYLPARNFGFLIISTSKGIITHIEAKDKNIGGRLLAYVY